MSKDWVTKYETDEYGEAMVRLVAMHRIIAESIRAVADFDKKIKIITLILSVLASGALWVLIAANYPEQASWAGASLSTFVTGLNIFQLTIGPGKQLEEYNSLYSEFGRSLAHAREHPDNFSWHNFKHLESSYIKLSLSEPSHEQIKDAKYTGML